MPAPQLFGVLVRAIGVYWVSHALTYFIAAFFPTEGYPAISYIAIGMGEFIVGAFLMFKADGMVETCYSYKALRASQQPIEPPAQQAPPNSPENEAAS